ncbi:MAG: CHASE2 domain-containing protein [Pseudomonadota bacterium]
MKRFEALLSRHPRLLALLASIVLTTVVLMLDQLAFLQRLEWPLRDAEMRWQQSQPSQALANDVVIVAFDEAYLQQAREPLALFHGHLAQALETLAGLQPSVIGVDFALPEKSFRFLAPRDAPEQDYDRLLMMGLARAARSTPIILATTLDESARRYRSILPGFLAASGLNPVVMQLGLDPRGSAILCPDSDGIIRRYPDLACRGGAGALPPLAAQMAAVQGVSRADWQGDINYLAGQALTVLPVQDVLAQAATTEGRARLLQMIGGRAVLLGAVLDYEDRHRAPIALAASNVLNQEVPGILIQAQIYRSLMNQGLLQTWGAGAVWPLIWLASLFCFGRRHALKLVLLLGTGALVAAGNLAAMQRGVSLPVMALLLTASLAWFGRWLFELRLQRQHRERLELAYAGSSNPALMNKLVDEPWVAAQAARVVWLSVRLSGRLDAMTIDPVPRLQALNAWLQAVREITGLHEGMTEPGDPARSISLFGYPLPLFAPERQALEAALALQLLWRKQSSIWRLDDLELHLAVHTDSALVGCIDVSNRGHFTALGQGREIVEQLLLQGISQGHGLMCSAAMTEALGWPPQLVATTAAAYHWQEAADA